MGNNLPNLTKNARMLRKSHHHHQHHHHHHHHHHHPETLGRKLVNAPIFVALFCASVLSAEQLYAYTEYIQDHRLT